MQALRRLRVFRKVVAVGTAAVLVATAPGLESWRLLAQEAVPTAAAQGPLVGAASVAGAAVFLLKTQRFDPAAPSLGVITPALSPAFTISPRPSAQTDAAVSVQSPVSRFAVMLRNLAGPSVLDQLPEGSDPETRRQAADSEFAARLGGAPDSFEEPPTEPAAGDSLFGFSTADPAPLQRNRRESALPRWADFASGGIERPHYRSPLFPAVIAAALAGLSAAGSGVHALLAGVVAHAAGVGAAGGAVLAGAASVASAAALIVAVPVAVYAAIEVGAFFVTLRRGRGVTDKEFWAFAREDLARWGLHPGVASSLIGTAPGVGILKAYRPAKASFSFGFATPDSIYLRPELARVPWLFRLILRHELSHYFSDRARAPPSAVRRRVPPRLLGAAWAELSSRLSDFRALAWLKGLRLPAPERVLREAALSLRHSRPFDLLVVQPTPGEWSDPRLYKSLSGGLARVRELDASRRGSLSELLSDPEAAGRYRALVLSGASLRVPDARSPEGKRIAMALHGLDGLYLRSKQWLASGGAGFEPGGAQARRVERMLATLWLNAVSTTLKDIEQVRVLSSIYASLANRGIVLLPWSESEPGLATIQRLLRYWRGPDGGKFSVERVDLPEGGHVLVATKLEPRALMWIKAREGHQLRESRTNINVEPAESLLADFVLAEAGFAPEHIGFFKSAGLVVRHAFGADVGMNHVYVSVPRSKARMFRRHAGREGVEISASRGGFEPHLIQSGPIERIPGAWALGLRGEGMRIYDIDTGLDVAHPDFADRAIEEDDVVSDGHGDFAGHGTHKGSISYANGPLHKGMAPRALGRMGKVFSRRGDGASDGDIMAAAVEAVKWKADVISLSLGSPGTVGSALAEFFSNLARERNIIVTASAGNSGPFPMTLSQPGAGGEVDTAGASAKSLDDGRPEISFFSSNGPAGDRRFLLYREEDKPDDAPLGGDIATRPGSRDVYEFGIEAAKSKDMPKSPSDAADGLHTRMSGTSMSNPMTAGINALIKQMVLRSSRPGSEALAWFNANTAFAVKAIRVRTDKDMGVPWGYQGKGFPDAEAAVKMGASSFGEAPPGPLSRVYSFARTMGRSAGYGGEDFGWIRRAKAVRDLELQLFKDADAAAQGIEGRARKVEAAQMRFNELRPRLLPEFLAALKDPVWLVRAMAAWSLGNIKAPEAVFALLAAALGDPDARVRQRAFRAIAQTPSRAVDETLKRVATQDGPPEQVPLDARLYAAYALARHGDGAGVGRILEATRHADKAARFTAVWLLGQLGTRGGAQASLALGAVAADERERGNIRHLAVPSLAQLAQDDPRSFADEAFLALLRSAGPQNLALTRTVGRFFAAVARRRELVERMRLDPLRGPITGFVLAHQSSVSRPGPLGELVALLAHLLSIPIETPSPLPMEPESIGTAEAASTWPLQSLAQEDPTAERSAHGPPRATGRAALKDLKRVLADGTRGASGAVIAPFRFLEAGRWVQARSAGLEGFLYSKLELERVHGALTGQMEDYFKYLDALLASVPEAALLRAELARLGLEDIPPAVKSRRLNEVLVGGVQELQARAADLDAAAWGRGNATYMIFSRAYNRLKPGKDFFDSLDEDELARIRDASRATEVWLMDIFEIGELNRWGTGGGSPYSIKGYRVKPELGGEAGLARFIRRAHALGLRVKVDFIPNHSSLDSDMVRALPEGFLHLVPPQPGPGEDLEAYRRRVLEGVPRESDGDRSPVYYLVHAENYPEGGRRVPKWILLHHPRTNYGDDMWVDLAQIDYTRPEARDRQARELGRLFTELGVDSVRRDMAYEILNVRYYRRWLRILREELEATPSGWAREETVRLIAGFKARWAALGGAEFIEDATDAAKTARPDAVMIDEAYADADALSRSGSDGIYNKASFDEAMGQVGLYDAMQSRDAGRVRAALRNVAFHRWARGGAPLVNFIGTHDGGEGNPVDKFGRLFRAAAATALLLRPILFYNGLEQGVGQKAQLIGDLARSVDLAKAIPFDIPVKINWEAADRGNQDYLKRLLALADARRALLEKGAMEVLDPGGDGPVAAFSVGLDENGVQKALLVAANYSEGRANGAFAFARPILGAFGAFVPRADRDYVLRDHADLDADGRPRVYIRPGKTLLEEGLYVELPGGGAHLFEVEEETPAPAGRKGPFSWDAWTRRLTEATLFIFTGLQVPQLLANVANLHAGRPEALQNLPWTGYSTGILANMLLLAFFVSLKDRSPALVQAVGVLTSAFVVAQIFMAGFMPAAALWTVAALVAAGLLVNGFKWFGRPADNFPIWAGWNRLSALLGFFALPVGFALSFGLAANLAAAAAVGAVVAAAGAALMALERAGKLPGRLKGVWSDLGAWQATLLFMFGPVAQLVSNFRHPAGMAGIAVGTLLLGMLGNLLMLPRAVITKNRIWFAGSSWAVFVGGLAVLVGMYLGGFVAGPIFWAVALAAPALLAFVLRRNQKHYGDSSIWKSLDFLFKR